LASISFDTVTKRFDDVVAVDRLDLEVADGELLVLLGPSGCGKTTALRMVAGLEEPTSGSIRIGDRPVDDVEPKDRDVAMVFQGYALYPHLTVARNIEFPLRQRATERDERRRKVHQAAETLGLTPYLDRKPAALSGGQRQRVALARAIVRDPQAFLMDEPLSNLDATLRVQTRADIAALQRRLGTTTLYVTHDQVEAMTLGHRIAVLESGVLRQVAPPHELYARPADTFVASFLGSPGMNLLAGRLRDATTVEVSGGTVARRTGADTAGPVTVGIRPEHLRIDPEGTLGVTVDIVEQLGAEAHVIGHVDDGTRVVVRQDATRAAPAAGDAMRVAADPDQVHLFEADTGKRREATR
jgi:multiple sugar transport system ATP-binding protein